MLLAGVWAGGAGVWAGAAGTNAGALAAGAAGLAAGATGVPPVFLAGGVAVAPLSFAGALARARVSEFPPAIASNVFWGRSLRDWLFFGTSAGLAGGGVLLAPGLVASTSFGLLKLTVFRASLLPKASVSTFFTLSMSDSDVLISKRRPGFSSAMRTSLTATSSKRLASFSRTIAGSCGWSNSACTEMPPVKSMSNNPVPR